MMIVYILLVVLILAIIAFIRYKIMFYREYKLFKKNVAIFCARTGIETDQNKSDFILDIKKIADINSKSNRIDKIIARYLLRDKIDIREFNELFIDYEK